MRDLLGMETITSTTDCDKNNFHVLIKIVLRETCQLVEILQNFFMDSLELCTHLYCYKHQDN